MKELQKKIDDHRALIDDANEYAEFFEIEPSRKIDTDRDLEFLDGGYRLVYSERGRVINTVLFKDADELLFHFLREGIHGMVSQTSLGKGVMTEERLKKGMAARIDLMRRAKPEWIDKYILEEKRLFSQNLEDRKKIERYLEGKKK